MGAAIPIVGAVVGAAGTVANISAQKKQAQAQQDAIDSQAKALESNTNLRLMDLERQKLYAQYLAQIDEARRSQLKMADDQELQVARMRDELALSQAGRQNEEQYALGMYGNDNQLARANMANDTGLAVGNAQLNNQYQIGTGMLGNEQAAAEAALNLDYAGALGNANLGQANAFLQSLGIDQQALQARVGKQNEAYNLESGALGQATQVMAQVAQAYLNNRTQNKQNSKGRAAARAAMMGVGGGQGSRSMEALSSDNLENDLDQFVNTIMQGGRAADSMMSQLGISGKQADILRNLGSILGDSLSSQAEGTRGIAASQANLEKTTATGKYQNASNDVAYKAKLAGLNAKNEYVLNQLALQDQYALTKMGNEEQYTQNRLGMQSVMAQNRLNLNDTRQLNQIGFDNYQSARDVQFGIEQAQTELNKQFYDANLASSGNTIKSDAASQLASLRAARNSIQSPGLLSYASAGFGAYQAISGAIPQRQVPQPSQSQYGISNFNYQPGAVSNAPNFLGANNYGVLSGYKIGGY